LFLSVFEDLLYQCSTEFRMSTIQGVASTKAIDPFSDGGGVSAKSVCWIRNWNTFHTIILRSRQTGAKTVLLQNGVNWRSWVCSVSAIIKQFKLHALKKNKLQYEYNYPSWRLARLPCHSPPPQNFFPRISTIPMTPPDRGWGTCSLCPPWRRHFAFHGYKYTNMRLRPLLLHRELTELPRLTTAGFERRRFAAKRRRDGTEEKKEKKGQRKRRIEKERRAKTPTNKLL